MLCAVTTLHYCPAGTGNLKKSKLLISKINQGTFCIKGPMFYFDGRYHDVLGIH